MAIKPVDAKIEIIRMKLAYEIERVKRDAPGTGQVRIGALEWAIRQIDETVQRVK